jgi:hypothetical protein
MLLARYNGSPSVILRRPETKLSIWHEKKSADEESFVSICTVYLSAFFRPMSDLMIRAGLYCRFFGRHGFIGT